MAEINIIVPVYNVESMIHQCIDSILAQSFTDFKLILVDDGSPDNCGLICENYAVVDERIVVIHQENQGVSSARNAGIDFSLNEGKSQWITFVDSDDWVDKDYLKILYENTVANKTDCAIAGYVSTPDRVLSEMCSIDPTHPIRVTPDELFGRMYSFKNIEMPVNIAWGKLYRTSLFTNIRFPVGKINEDRFTAHKIAFQCDFIVLIPQPLYFYYLRDNSITRSAWSANKLDDIEAIREQIRFFETYGAPKSLLIAINDYYRVSMRQLSRIRALKNPEYRGNEKIIRKELLRCLVKYRKELNLTTEEKYRALFLVYPFLKRVVRKVKRMIK